MPYAVYEPANFTLYFCYDSYYNDYQTGYIYTDLALDAPYDKWGAHRESVENIQINPDFANARPSVTEYWFNGMKNVTSIEGLEYLNTSNVYNMQYMFSDFASESRAITQLDLRNFDTSNVMYMGEMFYGCLGLQTILVSNGWNTENVTLSNNMFTDCISLVGGDGTTYSANYTDKTKAFAGVGGYLTDPNLKIPYAVYLNDTLTFYYDFEFANQKGDVYTTLRTSSGNSWGVHKADITNVVFTEDFQNACPTSTAHWFSGCKNLMSISGIQYLDTRDVTNMYGMFNAAGANSGQLYIDLRFMWTDNVTNMAYMFNGCKGITSLDVTSFNTSNVTDMSYMFNGCSNLQAIYNENGNFYTSNVTNSTKMFYGCKKLVGGHGYTYNANRVEHTMANSGQEGYFNDGGSNVKSEFDFTDDATDINSIKNLDANNSVYTVSGVFVGKDLDLNTLNKGMYIINGKKVMLK